MLPGILASAAAVVVFVVAAWLIVVAAGPAARRIAAARVTRAVTAWVAGRRARLTRPIAARLLILATGAAVVITLGVVFVEVTEAVLDSDDLTVIDKSVLAWLAGRRNPAVTWAQIGITDLGSGSVLAVVLTVVALSVAVILRSWRPVLVSAVAAGGIQLLVYAIKSFVGRPRPDPAGRLVDAGGFSFPSGHSASAVVCFGTLAWLACLLTTHRQARATAWVAAGLLTAAVGVSRAYLGVHYPTDILGGWILGVAWLTTVAVAANTTTRTVSAPRDPHPNA